MGLEKINVIKKARGITSAELSQKSGVPLGTLNKILNGETKNPSYEVVSALAHALECSVDMFDDRADSILNNISNEKTATVVRIFEALNSDFQDCALEQIKDLATLQQKQSSRAT